MPLPFFRWRGLTLQLFLFIILPLTLLLIALAFGSTALHHEAMRSLVGDRDLRAVRSAAASLSHAVQHRETALQLAAVDLPEDLLNDVSAEGAASGTQPTALPPSADFDRGLALYRSDGSLAAASADSAPALLDAPALALAGLNPGSETAQPVILPEGGEGASGAGPALMVARAVPVPGRDLTLVGAYSPASLAHESLSGLGTGPTALLVVSKEGLLYESGMAVSGQFSTTGHPGVADVLRGESGVNYVAGPEGADAALHSEHGGEWVVAFAPISPYGWGLVLEEPWEATASPLLRASQSAPLVLAPALLLALAALWMGARQVVQPLQALEQQAARLAGGDFDSIRKPVGGISEIQSLQGELVEMSAALQAAQQALHGYIGALTTGVEEERRALARELHDDTLQALIALNQQVQLAMLRAKEPATTHSLEELQRSVNETITSLRRAIGGLRPIYLEDLGLAAALSMLAGEKSAAGETTVRFTQRGAERRLPPATELALYRIAQEALNNALHHARAANVEICLEFEAPGSARLTIRDDGSGFAMPADRSAFAHLGHYGLLGMHERAELAGAALNIRSAPGQGTRVEVRWPSRIEQNGEEVNAISGREISATGGSEESN